MVKRAASGPSPAGKRSQARLFDLVRRDQELGAFEYLHGTDATFRLAPARRRPLIARTPGGLDDGLSGSHVELHPAWLHAHVTDLAHARGGRADLCHDLVSAAVL